MATYFDTTDKLYLVVGTWDLMPTSHSYSLHTSLMKSSSSVRYEVTSEDR